MKIVLVVVLVVVVESRNAELAFLLKLSLPSAAL